MTSPVRFYLDTNILLDAIEPHRKNPNSTYLVERLKSGGDLSVTLSIFGLMEAVEQRQESAHMNWLVNNGYSYAELRKEGSQSRSLSPEECGRCYDEVVKFRKGLGSKLTVLSPASEVVWKDAAELVRSTNIGASDALHVAIANSGGCHVFATNDRQLIRELSGLHLTPRLIPLDCNRRSIEADFRTKLSATVRRVKSYRPATAGSRADARALRDSARSIKDFFSSIPPAVSSG